MCGWLVSFFLVKEEVAYHHSQQKKSFNHFYFDPDGFGYFSGRVFSRHHHRHWWTTHTHTLHNSFNQKKLIQKRTEKPNVKRTEFVIERFDLRMIASLCCSFSFLHSILGWSSGFVEFFFNQETKKQNKKQIKRTKQRNSEKFRLRFEERVREREVCHPCWWRQLRILQFSWFNNSKNKVPDTTTTTNE